MLSTPTLTNTLDLILCELNEAKNNTDQFIDALHQKQIPHLSFSQVAAVEFCPRRYQLQYIELVELKPTPMYFIKGKIFHQVIAQTYQSIQSQEELDPLHLTEWIDSEVNPDHRNHMHNATKVMLENLWQGYEIEGIEQPFVLMIDPNLPPCVGVIDLILCQGDQFIVIDHKTGRDFYKEDVLQMALYGLFIQEKYPDGKCSFYYDHYRWVNHLERIRKPAFIRNQVTISVIEQEQALERIRQGFYKIDQIRHTGKAKKDGQCFLCPYRRNC